MTDRPGGDEPEEQPQHSDDVQLGRRMFLFKAAALLGVAALTTTAATVGTSTPAEAQRYRDADPGDRARVWRRRYRTGRTDRDPYDRAGRGIRGPRYRRRRTDRDPYDRVGRGIR